MKVLSTSEEAKGLVPVLVEIVRPKVWIVVRPVISQNQTTEKKWKSSERNSKKYFLKNSSLTGCTYYILSGHTARKKSGNKTYK